MHHGSSIVDTPTSSRTIGVAVGPVEIVRESVSESVREIVREIVRERVRERVKESVRYILRATGKEYTSGRKCVG